MPNFHRIVLNPTALWVNLSEFLLCLTDYFAISVEDNGS
jgi:hypothetical protein